MASAGNYAWTIAIPDEYLAVSAKYVLRFKAASSTYGPNASELSSPGFLVLRAAPSTTSTSSSSTFTATTSSTIASTSTPPPSQTSTTNHHSISGGLSSGAKAGIGIGVTVAVLGVSGILCFLMRERKEYCGTCGSNWHTNKV